MLVWRRLCERELGMASAALSRHVRTARVGRRLGACRVLLLRLLLVRQLSVLQPLKLLQRVMQHAQLCV